MEVYKRQIRKIGMETKVGLEIRKSGSGKGN